MDKKDQEYVQSVKDDYSGRNMTVQAPEQRLLAIIDRFEAQESVFLRGWKVLEADNTSLKSQLRAYENLVEPFRRAYFYTYGYRVSVKNATKFDQNCVIPTQISDTEPLNVGHFRALALKGIKKVEGNGTRIRGMREAINNSLIEENATLKSQLRAIKKAGEPFVGVYRHWIVQLDKEDQGTCNFNWENHEIIIDEKGTELIGKHFRALAVELKKVEDG